MKDDPGGPLSRQFLPGPEEAVLLPGESLDPLAEDAHARPGRLVHRYHDRALLLVTDACAAYCRFCFRRYFVGSHASVLSQSELEDGCAYVAEHPEIGEIILSGGDPLTLPDGRIGQILAAYRRVRPEIAFRLSTRAVSVRPTRITADLVRLLADFRPLRVMLHVNHHAELGEAAAGAVELLRRGGVPLLSQTVLLRGVNDRAETLRDLYLSFRDLGIAPYYLFQTDIAAGTGHLRVPLELGFEVVEALRRMIPAEAMPRYAVDLVDGGGKIVLSRRAVVDVDEGWWYFRDTKGGIGRYPRERRTQSPSSRSHSAPGYSSSLPS